MKIIFFCIAIVVSICSHAQENDSLMHHIKLMTKETDPSVNLGLMQQAITKYQLTETKDGETIDMMKGIIAMNYVDDGKYNEFEKMVSSIQNKFNQTSYLNMAAATLLKEKADVKKAESLAKAALDLYLAIKDDPTAKPAGYPQADWNRFMKFAYYPYCDTYANALYAAGKYKEALDYQEKSFNGKPETGLPSSVERYANLLVLNNQPDSAYSLVLEMAATGKSTEGMNKLLQQLYLKKNGSAAGFDSFFADLQKNVVIALKEKLKKKMQNVEAPAFTLKDIDGKTVSLSDFKGKIVVLDFWATWCVPCKASFPAMKKMTQRHPEVKFLFIDTQENPDGIVKKVKKYITENQFGFHVLMDKPVQNNAQAYQVMSAYKVEGIPTKFVIDPNGKQRFFSVGFSSDTELTNELEAMIQLVAENT